MGKTVTKSFKEYNRHSKCISFGYEFYYKLLSGEVTTINVKDPGTKEIIAIIRMTEDLKKTICRGYTQDGREFFMLSYAGSLIKQGEQCV